MKDFKQFLESYQIGTGKASRFAGKAGDLSKEEELNLSNISSLKSGSVGAYKVKVSIHSGARAHQRRPDLTPDDWKKILERAIKAVRVDKKEAEYLIYSKEFDQGVVVNHIPNARLLTVVTILPKGKGFAKDGTKKVLVESVYFEEGYTTNDEWYDVIEVD